MRAPAAVAIFLSFVLAACGSQPDGDREPPSVTTPSAVRHEPPADLSAAVSDTREDSVHPEFGDPLVDALHYDLALALTPESDHLEVIERLTFRATADAREIRLDFHDALTIDSLTVDGEDAEFRQAEKDLTIAHEVTADTRHLIELTYSGAPESTPGHTRSPPSPRASAGSSLPSTRRTHFRRPAPSRGSRSTTSPPTRRSTTSRSPSPSRGPASRAAS
jgi:hypothetical protein